MNAMYADRAPSLHRLGFSWQSACNPQMQTFQMRRKTEATTRDPGGTTGTTSCVVKLSGDDAEVRVISRSVVLHGSTMLRTTLSE
eukprot:m.16782 g.16782  ORF g.16782 m.16782 type:complete len:85 (+) comp11027_c0_seq1:463-717(+)